MFIDYNSLNDTVTSSLSQKTIRTNEFRRVVLERDGLCVFTGNDETDCDAAHIIPRRKGSQVWA